MRLAILLGAIIIAESNGWNVSEESMKIYAYVMLGMLVADVLELAVKLFGGK